MPLLQSDTPNADAFLQVEFYTFEKDDPQWKGKPFVRIVAPGDKTLVYDQPATERHKQRFVHQWLHYQMKNAESQVIGTPLSQWRIDRPEELSDGQYHELGIMKFSSVEQVANATDGQVMRMGMGFDGVRNKARAYLSSRNAALAGDRLEKQDAEIAALKAMVGQLTANQGAPAAPAPRKRGGWNKGKKYKTRKTETQNVVNNDAATHAASGE
jgi:hypothetical protein